METWFAPRGFLHVVAPQPSLEVLQQLVLAIQPYNYTLFTSQKGKHHDSHLSDALRVFVLWLYGGVYIDLDMIFVRPLDMLCASAGSTTADAADTAHLMGWAACDNVIGMQSPLMNHSDSANGAVMVFTRPNSPFLAHAIRELARSYLPLQHLSIGPHLLTSLAQRHFIDHGVDCVCDGRPVLNSSLAQPERPVTWTNKDGKVIILRIPPLEDAPVQKFLAMGTPTGSLNVVRKQTFYRFGWGTIKTGFEVRTITLDYWNSVIMDDEAVIAAHLWHSGMALARAFSAKRNSLTGRLLRLYCPRRKRTFRVHGEDMMYQLQLLGPWINRTHVFTQGIEWRFENPQVNSTLFDVIAQGRRVLLPNETISIECPPLVEPFDEIWKAA